MKLIHRKWRYRLPGVGQLLDISVEIDGRIFTVVIVDDAAFEKMTKLGHPLGIPHYCCLVNRRTFMIHPAPSCDGRLHIDYFPPARCA